MDNERVDITSAAGLESDSKCVARSLKLPKEQELQVSKILIYLFLNKCNVSFPHGLMTRMVGSLSHC